MKSMKSVCAWTGIFAVMLFPVAGCGDASDEPSEGTGQPPPTSKTVGTEGGTVTSADGFSLRIPAGALSATTEITVQKLAERPAFALGPAYDLGPDGLTFAIPAELTLPIDAEIAGLPANMVRDAHAFSAPGGSSDFTRLKTLQISATEVRAETSHFTVFVAGKATPTTYSATEDYPYSLAVDAGFVYWTSGGNADHIQASGNDGLVLRAPRGGGAMQVLTPSVMDPKGIAVDDTYVYFLTGGTTAAEPGGPTGAAVLRVAKGGGAPEKLADAQYPQALVLAGDTLYWSDADLGQIASMPKAGGAPTVLATNVGKIGYMVDAGDALAWTAKDLGTVATLPKAGGQVSILASGQGSPAGIAVDAGTVYWAATTDNAVRRAPLGGGAVSDVIAVSSPMGLSVAGGYLYYGDAENSWIAAHKLTSGGHHILLAEGKQVPWRLLATPEGELFWLTAGNYDLQGTVEKLELP